MDHKKLYRSTTNRMVSGICGGLADYLNMDATVIRLLFAIFLLITGIFPGVFIYFIAAFIIPTQSPIL